MEYRFASVCLDLARHRLTREGAPVHVEPQVFALLVLLAERAGTVVSKDTLIERVWKGQIVSEATIGARISAARAAVGDTGRAQAIIRTVPRVGLELVPEVRCAPAEPEAIAPEPPVVAPPPRLATPGRMRMATATDGSRLAWSASGEGPPLLRAGHWLTNLDRDPDSPIWGPWLERMGRGRHLVRYDCRGTGVSGPACGRQSLDAFVDDLACVADAAGLDRFDIFASSQSVPVSLTFAARHPDRVRRIVSYGGWAQGAAMRPGAENAGMTDAMETMLRLGWGQPEGGYMRAFVSLFLPTASPEQVRAFVDLQCDSASAERAVEIRSVIARFEVTPVLAQVRCPVLVAHVRHESLHPFGQAQHLMQHLPDALLLPLEGQNHILMPDEPGFARLMDAVDAFLAD
ncbi:alpha/beta fold hydrolase [Ponticoccus alexandrii]|uniref:Alpha/beta fold hydrolase n=1 Tax=Ponticoccus alexandrii TaxID=1943633 RepID=A0ABX7F9B9_9RHOB|nr:alpha/beta fold hydrolase [Ponticoccus alexandrii]ETA51514.1 hypothetical protein P279_13515 [Rhodobacteraceae bacterium PD-2]QRF66719.1 alpha/beta fold hydrolase [Ponticoccus alexandrii]